MASDGQDSSLPLPKVFVRCKNQVQLYRIIDGNSTSTDSSTILLNNVTTTIPATFTPDGKYAFVHVSNVGIVRLDLTANDASNSNTTPTKSYFEGSSVSVQMMSISPQGNYLVTWERPNKDTNDNKNLKVWDTNTGNLLCGFLQKHIKRATWPEIQFTTDEVYAFLSTSSGTQLRVYLTAALLNAAANSTENQEPRYCARLQTGCSSMSIPQQYNNSTSNSSPAYGSPPPNTYYVTTFTSKTKDKPGIACVYEFKGDNDDSTLTKLASKSLFQAEDCTTCWNPLGTGCLVTLQASVDATGKSYYGSSQLLLWSNAANSSSEFVSVPLQREGPVLDVQWMTNACKPPSFISIAGNSPAMACQHHGVTGDVTFLFGNTVQRNTIKCSSHSRFVVLAGFGNLAGGISFWDTNKQKLIPHLPANTQQSLRTDAATMCNWCPNSRYFLVATTAPRMNVDNSIRLHKYSGEEITNLPWNNETYKPNHLYEACFVPSYPNVYPDRSQSPVPEYRMTGTASSAGNTEVSAASKPAGRYVPPSARGRAGSSGGGGGSLAERMRREKEGKLQSATRVTKTTVIPGAGRPKVVGMSATAGGGKSKSQIKREKLKQKKAAAAATPTDEAVVAEKKEVPVVVATETPAVVDPQKRIRKIQKLLKQITELKAKSDDLNDDQKKKIATEHELQKELQQLL